MATQQYYPVLHSMFWLEQPIWGEAVLGYHLVNVFQHAIACCLLAMLLLALWRGSNGAMARLVANQPKLAIISAWGAAALIAVHPVCVESVAWISEQKNTLSTMFYLLAARIYLRFDEGRRKWDYLAATCVFVLALGTKTVTSTLPAALLVIFWWQRSRLAFRRDVLPLLPWFAIAVTARLTTAWIERNLIGAEGQDYALSLGQRILLAAKIVWFYLGSWAWPVDLAFFYERWDVASEASAWWGYLLAASIVTIGLWTLRRKARGPLAVWLLWVGTLFPALGFFNVFPFAFSYVADHFQYLASFGLAGAVASEAALVVSQRSRALRRLWAGASIVVLLGFALLARAESENYQSNVTLFSASIAKVPNNWMAQRCMGWAYSRMVDREEDSVRHYRESLRLNPDSPDTCHGLAIMIQRLSPDAEEPEILLRRAIELRPDFADALYSLALRLKEVPTEADEMIDHLNRALKSRPDFAAAHFLLAEALSRLPDHQAKASFHFHEALRLNDRLAGAHLRLGRLYAALPGRQKDAEAKFRLALKLDEELAGAHFELANLLATQAKTAGQVVQHYETALRIQPGTTGAHFNLANTLARMPGRMDQAIAHFEAALESEPKSAEIHGNLANAYNSIGRREEALNHYQTALQLEPDLGWVHQNLALALATLPDRGQLARNHAREAVRLEPHSTTALNTLALIFAQQGALEEARRSWIRALELDPSFTPAKENLDRVNQLLNR